MDEVLDSLKQIISQINLLETNLLGEIANSRVETDTTLKQIATYLHMSMRNLSDVHDVVMTFNTTIENLKREIEKIDDIENRLIELPQNSIKLRDDLSKQLQSYTTTINKHLNSIVSYLKRLSTYVQDQAGRITKLEDLYQYSIGDIKSELSQNQEQLNNIINKLIDGKNNIEEKSVDLKTDEINNDTKRLEIKVGLIAKILSYIIGGGGLAYTIVDFILKTSSGS